MAIQTSGNVRIVGEARARCVSQVQRLLWDAGLSVVEEFDIASGSLEYTVLLVDTPGLLFESMALDRAAAVFLPVHVVIRGDGAVSTVSWANPVARAGLRPPATAKVPLETLCARVTAALSVLEEPAASAKPAMSTY